VVARTRPRRAVPGAHRLGEVAVADLGAVDALLPGGDGGSVHAWDGSVFLCGAEGRPGIVEGVGATPRRMHACAGRGIGAAKAVRFAGFMAASHGPRATRHGSGPR